MTNSRDDLMALAPCPFCGGEAERIDIPTVGSDPELGGDPNAGGSCISCKRCAASTALHFDRKENLYSSWNDRAASRSAPVDREAVARLAYEAVQFMEWAIGEGFMSTELPDPADTFCDAAKALARDFKVDVVTVFSVFIPCFQLCRCFSEVSLFNNFDASAESHAIVVSSFNYFFSKFVS